LQDSLQNTLVSFFFLSAEAMPGLMHFWGWCSALLLAEFHGFRIYKRKCPAGAEQIALCSPGLIIILIMGLYTLGYI